MVNLVLKSKAAQGNFIPDSGHPALGRINKNDFGKINEASGPTFGALSNAGKSSKYGVQSKVRIVSKSDAVPRLVVKQNSGSIQKNGAFQGLKPRKFQLTNRAYMISAVGIAIIAPVAFFCYRNFFLSPAAPEPTSPAPLPIPLPGFVQSRLESVTNWICSHAPVIVSKTTRMYYPVPTIMSLLSGTCLLTNLSAGAVLGVYEAPFRYLPHNAHRLTRFDRFILKWHIKINPLNPLHVLYSQLRGHGSTYKKANALSTSVPQLAQGLEEDLRSLSPNTLGHKWRNLHLGDAPSND